MKALRLGVRLLLLTITLNVIRYLVPVPLEQWLIFPNLFGAMGNAPDVFRTDFTTFDWVTSYGYNFGLWLGIVVLYHLMRPRFGTSDVVASLAVFGLALWLFACVSFIYMNHYAHPRAFYLWNVADAVIVFPIVAVANGVLYRRFLGRHAGAL